MKTIVNYAQKVKEQHALNKTLAPVEADPTASSKAYAIGQHFILNGELYKAKTAIALGDALVLDTNYEAAESIEAQIENLDAENQTLTNNLSDEVETRAALGTHNLYKFDLAAAKAANTSGAWNDNVYTVSGATFTVNDDDTITVNTNGTTTEELYFKVGTASLENGKQYKIVGCPSGGSNNSYLMAYKKDNSTYAIDTGNGASFTYASTDNKSIEIYIRSGQNLVDVVFKPMICVSTDKATTYQPYAKTNRELTDNLKDEIATRATLGAHNLLPNQISTTTGDMTGITKNEDGTVTIEPRTELSEGGLYFSVRGTKDFFLPNGSYIISGGLNNDIYISGGYTNTSGKYQSFGVDYGSGLSIIINGCNLRDDGAYITFWVGVRGDISNQLLVKPMIRLASDPSTEFAPYAKTNQQLTKDDNGLTENEFANGAVNLAKVTMSSQVLEAVTYTVNPDKTISASGTSSNENVGYLEIMTKTAIPKGRYKLSGSPSGGSESTEDGNFMFYGVLYSGNTNVGNLIDLGSGLEFDVSSDNLTIALYLRVRKNTNMTGKVFKPMITVADMPNSDYNHYVPYVMTNRELTPKHISYSGTTSTNGNLVLSPTLPEKAILLCVYASDATAISNYGYICTPYVNANTGTWVCHVTKGDGTLVVETATTVECWYIEP